MIAIIDYGAGNVKSVQNAFDRLGTGTIITADKEVIQSADKVIFPGVGHAYSAMKQIQEKGLDQVIPNLQQPVLGICLGMQLMCRFSEEGNTKGLGIFSDQVVRFQLEERVPHMGWNAIENQQGDLFEGIETGTDFYFVHSYYVPTSTSSVAQTNYGISFTSALQQNNFYAVQFHPEKSGESGERLLLNFLNIQP
tara:strand:+ start:1065 stop:1649 length:585 start_codon:yes stop_codon:yes gene_type:complete